MLVVELSKSAPDLHLEGQKFSVQDREVGRKHCSHLVMKPSGRVRVYDVCNRKLVSNAEKNTVIHLKVLFLRLLP